MAKEGFLKKCKPWSAASHTFLCLIFLSSFKYFKIFSNSSYDFYFDLWVMQKSAVSFPNMQRFSRRLAAIDFYFNYVVVKEDILPYFQTFCFVGIYFVTKHRLHLGKRVHLNRMYTFLSVCGSSTNGIFNHTHKSSYS